MRPGLSHTAGMKPFILVALGLSAVTFGIYGVTADDAPGAPFVSTLAMTMGIVLVVRAARDRIPVWAARTTIAAGVLVAAAAAFVTHNLVVTAPLFAESPPPVPSVAAPAPAPQYAAAVERARTLARSAVLEQNLPGVSVAVGTGGLLVWAEGLGWRDIVTKTPVTPDTRFNIGTAASVITAAAVAPLGLTNTGTDSAAEWSPSHNGEPEDDVPPFTFLHDKIFRPIGLADPAKPLPGDRATYYVPATQWRGDTADPRKGRRLIYMRDLACCANGKSFYSTPSDLVRFAQATNAGSVNGELAGGMVMSLLTERGIVVAVTSNITHANTSSLAQKVEGAFAAQAR